MRCWGEIQQVALRAACSEGPRPMRIGRIWADRQRLAAQDARADPAQRTRRGRGSDHAGHEVPDRDGAALWSDQVPRTKQGKKNAASVGEDAVSKVVTTAVFGKADRDDGLRGQRLDFIWRGPFGGDIRGCCRCPCMMRTASARLGCHRRSEGDAGVDDKGRMIWYSPGTPSRAGVMADRPAWRAARAPSSVRSPPLYGHVAAHRPSAGKREASAAEAAAALLEPRRAGRRVLPHGVHIGQAAQQDHVPPAVGSANGRRYP